MSERRMTEAVLSHVQVWRGLLLGLIASSFAELWLSSLVPTATFGGELGRVLSLVLGWHLLHRFGVLSLDGYSVNRKDVITIGAILGGTYGIIWLGELLDHGLAMHLAGPEYGLEGVSPTSLRFAIPFAAAPLLVRALMGVHVSLIVGIGFSLSLLPYFPSDPMLAVQVAATSLVASVSLLRVSSRTAYLHAGFSISLVSVAFALSSLLITGGSSFADCAIRLLCAASSGLLCAFVVAGASPLVESLAGYVTDMRLLEIATLDHPLLKALSVQAPGTWNHSMVMGMMAEAASDSVGANPVLARVGAYFHDIGKLKKPLYFVENQVGGENRHDKLSPSMSALIIKSHVKEGVELAEAHSVPRIVIEFIPQHHGTAVIEYFYEKACREAEDQGENYEHVDKSLYMYPGPKPQTKEAGLLMLADGIEAAARTVAEPSPDRIQGVVQKMINKIFASGQLDECELTLKDLHLIAKAFTRVLTGIYHQRVAYAEPAEKGAERSEETPAAKPAKPHYEADGKPYNPEILPQPGSTPRKKKRGREQHEEKKEPTKEELKRLGI